MIDAIIKEIKDAEERADEMQKEAYQQAKDIVLTAELDAESLKKQTAKDCKENQKAEILKAEEDASRTRESIIKKGNNEALLLQEEKNKLAEEKADEIVEILLNKYCK